MACRLRLAASIFVDYDGSGLVNEGAIALVRFVQIVLVCGMCGGAI
jgi:hypothetical protein